MKTTRPHFFAFFTVILFVVLSFTSNIFAQPQYYNYNTQGTNNNFPLGISTGKTTQSLYLAGAFNQPNPAPSGNITKIYLMCAATGSATYSTFTVKLGQTTDIDLPTGAWYTGSMTTVLDTTNMLLAGTAGQFITLTLEVPFAYNPAQSLVIEIAQCGYTGSSIGLGYTILTGTKRSTGPFNPGACPHIFGNQNNYSTHMGVDIAPPSCSFTWGTQTSGVTALLQTVSTPSQNVCWIGGATATVRLTTNGGSTWVNANPNPGVITGDVYNIWAIDATTALLTTSPSATFIYRTTNSGTNWTQVFTQAGGFIDAIVMANATTGYAYGDPVSARWSLWKTTNGGVNWDSTGMYLPQAATEAGWNNAMCVVGNNIWFGTNNTKVYRSTNGGATGSWTGVATTGNLNTYGVWFTSPTNGICVGTIVQKTTDGGATWVNGGAPAGTGNMTSIAGLGDNYWLTRGANIYGSTDFGATWTGAGFTGVAANALWGTFITSGSPCLTGWSVGANGTLVKLNGSPVAINDPSSLLPSEYRLSQNYPNPFNPTTSITFDMPASGNVELKIYDILGKEIAVLVNGEMNPGTHVVPFDASSLASGVYIYKLTSGSFSDSKKMVLIK
ncbi:MAG: T9SS type A sorting domain-containing protein [Ignavibacteria bacterium]|nr:T9SS type A sorting domain-containing protein [Ignavibacteria bacterium]